MTLLGDSTKFPMYVCVHVAFCMESQVEWRWSEEAACDAPFSYCGYQLNSFVSPEIGKLNVPSPSLLDQWTI